MSLPEISVPGPIVTTIFPAPMQMVGSTPAIRALKKRIPLLASSSQPLVLVGEPGTGKSLTARLIHESARFRSRHLLVINFATLPERDARIDLMGGAPPELTTFRRSVLEQETTVLIKHPEAAGIYLQEVLARALASGRIRRPGTRTSRLVLARVILSLERSPARLARTDRLAPELSEFLKCQQTICLPPLRTRRGDIGRLCKCLCPSNNSGHARAGPFRPSRVLQSYPWPGNITELKALIHAIAFLSPEEALQAHERKELSRMLLMVQEGSEFSLREGLKRIERCLIERAMEQTRGKSVKVARLLGFSVREIRRKLTGAQEARR